VLQRLNWFLVTTQQTPDGYIHREQQAHWVLGGYAVATSGAFQIKYERSSGLITFNGGSRDTPIERIRIDNNGGVGFGSASAITVNPAKGVNIVQNANYSSIAIGHDSGALTGSSYSVFSYNSATIGSITQNGTTGVLFNTTSDYRLKQIDGPVTASGEFIDALNPVVGSWKIDGSPFVGFLAHEFQEVSPSSVTGEKDAVDEDGEPVLQTMQASSPEVMANVVAELQFLRRRVTSLEEEVSFLKAA
jgi:hypothetical protein